MKTLNIYDPSLTTTLGTQSTRPTGVKVSHDLDLRTKKVRNMLRETMQEYFYKQYHPIQVCKKKGNNIRQKQEYHFLYQIDMQALLHPAPSNGKLLQKVILSFKDATRDKIKNVSVNHLIVSYDQQLNA
jgi:hypothetical protein